jgi:hypothetical protein
VKFLQFVLAYRILLNKIGKLEKVIFSSKNEEIEIQKIIQERIIRYSELFCNKFLILVSDKGLNYTNLLNVSLLCVTWSKINFYEKELFDKCSDALKEVMGEASEDSIEEICKIFWAFNNLNYKNEGLVDSLHLYLENNIEKVYLMHLLDLFISFSNMYPERIETTELLVKVIRDFNFSILTKTQIPHKSALI